MLGTGESGSRLGEEESGSRLGEEERGAGGVRCGESAGWTGSEEGVGRGGSVRRDAEEARREVDEVDRRPSVGQDSSEQKGRGSAVEAISQGLFAVAEQITRGWVRLQGTLLEMKLKGGEWSGPSWKFVDTRRRIGGKIASVELFVGAAVGTAHEHDGVLNGLRGRPKTGLADRADDLIDSLSLYLTLAEQMADRR